MAKEVLYVPEEYLKYVIRVIRSGLKKEKVPKDVSRGLLKWCKDEERYLRKNFLKDYYP